MINSVQGPDAPSPAAQGLTTSAQDSPHRTSPLPLPYRDVKADLQMSLTDKQTDMTEKIIFATIKMPKETLELFS